MKKKSKKFVTIFTLIVMLSCTILSPQVSALTFDKSYYDGQSWTWSYLGPATSSYNCLGYATGTMKWEWPWNSSANPPTQIYDGYPTLSTVTTYLANKGYKTSGTSPRIVVYGTSYRVTHFSKVTTSTMCAAKWGQYELMSHNSHNPYYANSSYGLKLTLFF